jgi:hypothetical protein
MITDCTKFAFGNTMGGADASTKGAANTSASPAMPSMAEMANRRIRSGRYEGAVTRDLLWYLILFP